MNYLASPPLVVAYALAGRIDIDLATEPMGTGSDGAPVYLRDVWPSQAEIEQAVATAVKSEMFVHQYADVFAGDEAWSKLAVPDGETFAWEGDSTYVQERRTSRTCRSSRRRSPTSPARAASRCSAIRSPPTTFRRPARSRRTARPAGTSRSTAADPADFNSYGSRRGNHEVMVRGTFANVRIRNRMMPEIEGGATVHLPEATPMSIYDAAARYAAEGVPLVVLAGKEYGSGSSRDWAAKGRRCWASRRSSPSRTSASIAPT